MVLFFKQRNATQLPYIELFAGRELVDTLVVAPSRVAYFTGALGCGQPPGVAGLLAKMHDTRDGGPDAEPL